MNAQSNVKSGVHIFFVWTLTLWIHLFSLKISHLILLYFLISLSSLFFNIFIYLYSIFVTQLQHPFSRLDQLVTYRSQRYDFLEKSYVTTWNMVWNDVISHPRNLCFIGHHNVASSMPQCGGCSSPSPRILPIFKHLNSWIMSSPSASISSFLNPSLHAWLRACFLD